MTRKHKRTLEAIYEQPVRADVAWADIEKLIRHIGGTIEEGSGSRVRIALNGIRAVFHRPHPKKETDKGALKSMKRFLAGAGVRP